MEKDLRELRVFMASPGDLTDERDALRNLERRLNAMFRERGVRVSIEGWEDVQPDAGAPQELINPLVYSCDVFVGLLNVRWGTPTDNDSSGFSEEFNIALKRRQENGTAPTVGMYFREIDPERLRDRGPQLEAVLAFKERVEAERLVLHKTFSGTDDLALEVMNFLLPHALRIADEVSASTAELSSGSSGSTPANDEPETLESAEAKTDDDDSAGEPDSAQLQIMSALSSFSNLFLGGTSIAPETRDRVTLAAEAFAQEAETLGSHHVNRLFKNRENLDLTLGEARIWYRTFFENYGLVERDHRVVPIWGLIPPDRLDDRFIDELATLATDDNSNVVRGVLRFLTEHVIRPRSFWEPDPAGGDGEGLSFEPRTAETPAARWADLFGKFSGIDSTLNYMVAVASLEDLELLKGVADLDAVDDRTRDLIRAAIDVMAGDLTDVGDLAPTRYSGNDTSALRDLVVNSVPQLQADQWSPLLVGTHWQIAVAAALQIVEHENISAEQLKTVSELKSAEIECALVERARRDMDWALLQIKELTDRDEYGSADMISRLLAASVSKESLELLDRDETLDVRAWVALTIQNPHNYLESARDVLDGTSEWLNKRKAPLADKYAVIAEHMTAKAKGAACLVLSQAAEIIDADVERVSAELRRDSYVSRSSALHALIAIVTRTERALPSLGDLTVLDSYGFLDDAEFVLDSPLARVVAPVWAVSKTKALQELGRAWRLRQQRTSDVDLEEALYLDSETLRMVALDQLMSRWSDGQLRELLDRYGDQNRQWWYNIIAALDERLFGFGRQAISVRE
ncbi:DUF4062 domain-containing protein [Paramicrobacterium fandaimingii]|uniref:DUF4062 domain-containing protein n=1 Tax=Paramicrobacterium fandaimingii TaxID=2708079 RepID=UPI001FD31B71|nr:DUF4062 domain-containing protein [Microbacterium fandaimingii]